MILFTSDWQVTARNLDMIRRVEERIFQVHKDTWFSTLIHCGDVKHILNPVDGRVTNYLIEMVTRMNKKFRVIFLLGNHDKFSNQEDARNFFPVLRAAGAEAYDEPWVEPLGDYRIHFLPFNSNLKTAKKWAVDLAGRAGKGSVLVMHETLVGCSLNGRKADVGLTREDLHADAYEHVISGHIHQPQKLGNFQYVGSPFSQDWGEVNQKKFFLLLAKNQISRIPVGLPGLYDPSLKSFEPQSDYTGSSVRLFVTGPDDILPRLKEQAIEEGQKKYPGATIIVNSLRDENGNTGSMKASRDDAKTIKRYVKKMLPPLLSDRADMMNAYLLAKLTAVGGVARSTDGVTFLEAEGKNFLSFETVTQNYVDGLHVVRGQSMDWKGRSNGVGKTNFLQLLAVGLTGDSMKGQRHDRWVRRGSMGEAFVKLKMRLPDGRELTVERRRKPKAWLKMWLDGEPYHTGAGPNETQKALEELTGFTRETLANSVYLDQGKVNQMLDGTDAERKVLLSKFLNLERFTRAQELVKQESKKLDAQKETESRELVGVTETGKSIRATLDGWQEPDVAGLKKKLKAARVAVEDFPKPERRRVDTTSTAEKLESLNVSIGEYSAKISEAEERIVRVEKLGPICSKCGQRILASRKKETIAELEGDIKKFRASLENLKQNRASLRKTLDKLEEKNREYERLYYKALNEKNLLIADVENALARLEEAEKEAARRAELEARLEENRTRYRRLKASLEDMEKEAQFLTFAVGALGKSGIPALLIAEACPAMNAAAEYYADLIADGEIRVTFKQVGDDLSVTVLNRYGGESLEDQSCGETRTASLIVSLAIREVTVPCNLLIADEPGDGLDEVGAGRLAQALGEVAGKFGCVYVISHNPNILAELEDYPQIVVEKSSGVSRCV